MAPCEYENAWAPEEVDSYPRAEGMGVRATETCWVSTMGHPHLGIVPGTTTVRCTV